MSTTQRMETTKPKYKDLWTSLPWAKLRRKLFKLQVRMWKAARKGDKATVLFLQRLILRSRGARLLAIRQVTQLNAGKRTAGVDGKSNLSHKERFELESQLREQASTWKPSRLKSIPIPKKDGTTRILKVPTISDRAWQCLAKSVIEPAHEAQFHARSYGFRPGRSAHDAQRLLFQNLNSRVNGLDKKILELDIEKCFDKINHNALMAKVKAPYELKLGLWKTLKAGANPGFPDEGTLQGDVISPLLANIALDGIEDVGRTFLRNYGGLPVFSQSTGIRYADDMVFIIKPRENPQEVLSQIVEYLADAGLKVNETKTRLVASTDGFDFLGWHFKVKPNGKHYCVPSEDNYKAFRKKVKNIVNHSGYGAKVKATKLTPIVRGWRRYHRFCDMSGLKESLWTLDQRTAKVFNKERKQNRRSVVCLAKKAFPKVGYEMGAHVMVEQTRSPYDGDLVYWSKRNGKYYDGPTSTTLAKQNHTCGFCGQHLMDDERVHLHHVDGDHSNWKPKNLIAVHQSCHQNYHMSKGYKINKS